MNHYMSNQPLNVYTLLPFAPINHSQAASRPRYSQPSREALSNLTTLVSCPAQTRRVVGDGPDRTNLNPRTSQVGFYQLQLCIGPSTCDDLPS